MMQKNEILADGFDGVLFDGMGGPEVAILTDAAQLEGVKIPIPRGIQALIESRKSLPESVVRDYEIKLPEGYELNNGSYIFNG